MSYYQHCREEIKPFIPENYSRVLEIGCGQGIFRTHLSLPHSYWGIEPSADAASTALKNLDHVLHCSFENGFDQLPDEHFDLIICNDVIEHLPDTDDFLQNIRKKMSVNAYIIGSVPNIRFFRQLFELLIKRDWQYRSAGILDNTHLRFYTEKSFRRTLEKNGFVIEALSGINGSRPKSAVKRIIRTLIVGLLGKDSAHPQMAFRARKTSV